MPDSHNLPRNEDGDGQVPSPSAERCAPGLEEASSETLSDPCDARRRQGEETLSFGRWLTEIVVLLVVAWVLALGIKTFVVQPFIIPSSSMEPTLMISDRVLVNRFVYRFTSPKPGDIVVFVSPEDGSTDLIKRVIAVGCQTIDIRNGTVLADAHLRVEPFVNQAHPAQHQSHLPPEVPPARGSLPGRCAAIATHRHHPTGCGQGRRL